ncbi:MAG: hypothetical protein NTV08_12405, partial [Verrucomicrobia bacterium]|nr:hypothetical protein [Verrucomicrobiota bacterium]
AGALRAGQLIHGAAAVGVRRRSLSRAPGQKSLEKAAKNRCRTAKTAVPCAESVKRGGAIGKKPRARKLQPPPQQSGQLFSVSLTISNGIARVRLAGGANSHGSTLTIANEIIPILKQFPTVTWVKIYDQNGQTETPTGQSDSIPTWLEP